MSASFFCAEPKSHLGPHLFLFNSFSLYGRKSLYFSGSWSFSRSSLLFYLSCLLASPHHDPSCDFFLSPPLPPDCMTCSIFLPVFFSDPFRDQICESMGSEGTVVLYIGPPSQIRRLLRSPSLIAVHSDGNPTAGVMRFRRFTREFFLLPFSLGCFIWHIGHFAQLFSSQSVLPPPNLF